ncbi:MAG: hypothetical protein FJW23_04575 [Acidimicrobiia bacterium]|nr:hypothetical protein [Acidimicrobiia bacterium]
MRQRHLIVVAAMLAFVAIGGLHATTPEPPVVQAARDGDLEALRAIVQRGDGVADRTPDGTTALHWAASRGDLDAVIVLLAAGVDARAANRYGVRPLSLAAASGSGEVIDRLLAAGARVDDELAGGETPLMTAARSGSVAAVKVLLARGADPNAREATRGQTALMWAAAEGHGGVVRALVEGGADVAARSREVDFRSYTPMRGGSAIGDVATGVTIEFSPLMFAVRAGARDGVAALIDLGANVNETLPDGTSALVVAAINANWDVGLLLLERGADPNAMAQGWNALHQVARTRTYNLGNVPHPLADGSVSSLAFAQALVDRGVDTDAQMTGEIRNDGYRFNMSRIGATAFLIAAKGADAPMMRLLAAAGADAGIANEDGTTALMAAAGVDLDFLGEDTGTHEDAFEALKVALEHPHDVNAANASGDTPLHGAARRGAIPIVEELIARGARLDVTNRRGWTPLTVALGRKNGRPLFLNEQRQFAAAEVIRRAMIERGIAIEEDAEALELLNLASR